MENATVIIARGVIKAVGKDAAIPDEAWVVEGKGLIVYPGIKGASRRENTIWKRCFSGPRPELKAGTGSDTSVRLENRCCKCRYVKIKAPILLRGRP